MKETMIKTNKARSAIKSLRWLVFNFPQIEKPNDDFERMCNCVHLYCKNGADVIEELLTCIDGKVISHE